MTDIGDWPKLIERKDHYIMVPFNEYQMGNLVDALSLAEDTGDWFGECLDIIAAAMRFAGIKELASNRGGTYILEQVANRLNR